jgi:DNA-binding response OmpR family regulator
MSQTQNFKAVLLVDDDHQLTDTLQAALTGENFLVDVAHDGEEAFLKAKVHKYDAIVCDMVMPKLRGDEFYEQAVAYNPDLAQRFLFITGHADDGTVRDFLQRISARYLLKPFGIQNLIDAINQLVA